MDWWEFFKCKFCNSKNERTIKQSTEIRDQVQFPIQVAKLVLGNTTKQDMSQELIKNSVNSFNFWNTRKMSLFENIWYAQSTMWHWTHDRDS